ncbi:hypothetical protein EOM82_02120 [bacterium]|nr:hypothetical protein [bacterium]
MKKYYCPVKEYEKRKKRHPFFSFTRAIVRLFFPENQFIWKTEKPKEGEVPFFVCNHTKIYAPVYFTLQKNPTRVWANYYFLFFKTCWQHIYKRVLPNVKMKFILYPLAFLLTPVIVLTFRAINPIPVYHFGKTVYETFNKSIQTMEEGMPQVIFPERTENRVNKYIYEFNAGFPMVAKEYYEKTGKIMKFYPVYCAQKLNTFVVGEPISYDPNVPIKLQRASICRYLEKKIEELGDSLPPHEVVPYV